MVGAGCGALWFTAPKHTARVASWDDAIGSRSRIAGPEAHKKGPAAWVEPSAPFRYEFQGNAVHALAQIRPECG
jgi:hypothetical protein